MKIIADRNMPFAKQAFETLGDVSIRDGRTLCARDVRDADALVIRSTTRVNAALLEGSRVRFVGTATIGTDHLDIPWLEQHGIHWSFSPGCNANSVSEYFTAALLQLATANRFSLAGKTVGVIGVGNVGKKVAAKARALGMRVLLNDPPRRRQALEADPETADTFVGLEALLEQADIITLHVPMTHSGPDATFHLADETFFERMRPDCIFINAARGAVVDSTALSTAIDGGKTGHCILDTWEGEPAFNPRMLDRVDIGTPHIAGHSFEGKANGTLMVYQALCKALGFKPSWTLEPLMPTPPVPAISLDANGKTQETILHEIVNPIYDIMAYDRRMRAPAENLAVHFDGMRRHYPMRREFRFTRVQLAHASEFVRTTVADLGFMMHTD